jgi:hypothetical protein
MRFCRIAARLQHVSDGLEHGWAPIECHPLCVSRRLTPSFAMAARLSGNSERMAWFSSESIPGGP